MFRCGNVTSGKSLRSRRRQRGQRSSATLARTWRFGPGIVVVLLWCAVLSCCALVFIVTPAQSAPVEDDKVERLLERLGLRELQILHLEQILARDGRAEDRAAVGKRLANLYAEALTDGNLSEGQRADLMARVGRLLQDIPEANTTALQVTLLQAEYAQAEKLIVQWMSDPRQPAPLREAATILIALVPQLTRQESFLESEVARLNDELDGIDDEDKRTRKEKDLSRLLNVHGRALFFTGWANYYLAFTKRDSAESRPRLTAARTAFRKLLAIEKDDYADLEVEWLGLSAPPRALAMTGLCQTESALGNVDAALACYEILQSKYTAPEVRESAAVACVRGMVYWGHSAEAKKVAAPLVARFLPDGGDADVQLAVALFRGGFALPHAADDPQTREVGMLGVEALARLKKFAALNKLLADFDVSLAGAEGFIPRWIHGRRLFAAAEKSKSRAAYQAAARALSGALDEGETKRYPDFVADCRFVLAWCRFYLDEVEAAARLFESSAPPLKEAASGSAVQSAWMAFVAYRRLSQADAKYVDDAVRVLQLIKREFPQSEYAKKADYYMAKVQLESQPLEVSIAKLSQVKPADSNYLTARFEICLLQHRRWEKLRGGARDYAADDVFKAVDAFLAAAADDADHRRKMRAALLASMVALSGEPPNIAVAERFLRRADSLAPKLKPGDVLLPEYHYRRFQLALSQNDALAAAKHTDWLTEHGGGSSFQAPALIMLARRADAELKAASPGERTEKLRQAHRAYRRLLDSQGDSAEQLASSRNSRVAALRTAEYAAELGKHHEAAQLLERLLTVAPSSRVYLRRLGLAQFHAGRHSDSLSQWRKLVRGLKKGSPEWHEAKYYQLACLDKIDRAQAHKVMKNYKIFYPDFGPPPWRDKLAALDRRISQ